MGPGNLYVTAAKRLVAFDCAIDMLAGPTEIVVTSERGNAADIASDLVAQAEHDPEALAIFVTTREDLARAVIAEAKARSRENAVARESLERNGLAIVAGSVEEARAITNRLAPEHLTVDAASDLEWVRMPARFLWAAGRRSPWAITSPGRITRCPPAAWRACAAD